MSKDNLKGTKNYLFHRKPLLVKMSTLKYDNCANTLQRIRENERRKRNNFEIKDTLDVWKPFSLEIII